MRYTNPSEADERLRDPRPLTEDELADLLVWMPKLGEGSLVRLQAHLGANSVRAIRALDETTSKIEGAIRRMDEGSTRLGVRGLTLNYALFGLTVVGIVLSVVGVWIALKSYKAADASAGQQQQTLDSSRHSLEAAVQSLDRLTSIAETQQKELEAYQKETLAKPEITLQLEAPSEHARPKIRRVNTWSVMDLTVPYGSPVMLVATLQNAGAAAHDVRVRIEVTDQVEDPMSGHPPHARIPNSNIIQMGEYDFPVLYHGAQTFVLPVRIKSDAPDYTPQVIVNIDGSNLKQHYQRIWVLRKKQ